MTAQLAARLVPVVAVAALTIVGSCAGADDGAAPEESAHLPTRTSAASTAPDVTAPAATATSEQPATTDSPRWGPPRKVSPYASRDDSPEVRIRLAGRTTEAWWIEHRRADHTNSLVTSSLTAGRWGPTRSLGPTTAGPGPANMLVDATVARDGRAAVVWQARLHGRRHLVISDRVDGVWGAPHPLARNGSSARVVIGPHGGLTVAWKRLEDNRTAIHVASRSRAGVWEDDTVWRFDSSTDGGPDLAVDAQGNLVLAWAAPDAVSVTTRAPGGPWAPPTQLAVGGSWPWVDDVAVAIAAGRALVVWNPLLEADDSPTHEFLAWSETTEDGSWTETRQLSDTGDHYLGGLVGLSLNRHGIALAVWNDSQIAPKTGYVRAARFTFGAGWSTVEPVRGTYSFLRSSVFLADSGSAALTSGAFDPPVASFHQVPGQPWRRLRLDAGPEVLDASGSGLRLTVLYYDPDLTTRTLRLG